MLLSTYANSYSQLFDSLSLFGSENLNFLDLKKTLLPVLFMTSKLDRDSFSY